jgi:hypothetical protein
MYAFRLDTSSQTLTNQSLPSNLHANGKTEAGKGNGRDEVESRGETVESTELLVDGGHGGGWLWVSCVRLVVCWLWEDQNCGKEEEEPRDGTWPYGRRDPSCNKPLLRWLSRPGSFPVQIAALRFKRVK